jgi:tetratricopeptide (TPR) repeat protein
LLAAYTNRGLAYANKSQYNRAIADYDQAIRINPTNAIALFNRGMAHEHNGEFNNALTDFRETLARNPNDRYAAEAVRRMERKLGAKTEPTHVPSRPRQSPSAGFQESETRIALLIGNSAYLNFGTLANPGNDARGIEAALKGAGFTSVTLVLDLPREKLIDALKTFSREAAKADWALIYFAGRGLELGGINYLVPVDARLSSDLDASYEAVELQRVLDAVGLARKIGLVILDACRDNPFVKTMTRSMPSTRSIGRGLAQIEPEGATLVAYAAKHGQVALDGAGTNSPFVTALIKNLEVPGVGLRK